VSFDVQRSEVLTLATRHGDPEPELIVEWGVSGAAKMSAFGGTGRGGRRHAYHQLRASVEADQVSALYAYSLSRLARSTRELLDLTELCVAHNVPIHLAKEGDIIGTTASGRLYLTVLAAVSTFEAEVSAERARDRNDSMRERGAHLGRAPYGFLLLDGHLAPDPAAAGTLQRVLTLYGELHSPAKVARALNDADVPAPQGQKWRDGTIRRILARQPGHKPQATVRGSRAVPVATFARLLHCPCGALMTPARKHYRTADGVVHEWMGYTCQGARFVRSHGPERSVPERLVLEAVKEEVAHYHRPLRITITSEVEDPAIAARKKIGRAHV
jgi:DNA invertase Pin-like site-specific DNA recombinase